MRTRRRNWKILISLVTIIAMLSAMTVMVGAATNPSVDKNKNGPIEVELEKTVDVEEVELGGTITYTLKITNLSKPGWATVFIESFSDALLDDFDDIDWNIDIDDGIPSNGGVAIGTYTVLVSDSDYDPFDIIVNEVSIGFDALNNENAESHTHIFDLTVSAPPVTVVPPDYELPEIEVTKSVDPSTINVGDEADYVISIENLGTMDVTIDSITDTWQDLSDYVGDIILAGQTLNIPYSLTFDEIGTFENTVVVSVSDEYNQDVSDEASAEVTVLPEGVVIPTVTLDKSADRIALLTTDAALGLVNYQILITNTSPDTVYIYQITDTYFEDVDDHVGHVLSPYGEEGDSLLIEYEDYWTAVGTYTNTASVIVALYDHEMDDDSMARVAMQDGPEPILSDPASDSVTVTVSAPPPPGSSSTKYTTPPAEEIIVAGAEMPEPEPEVVVMGAEMPKTGDNSNNLFAIIGLLVLAASGILIFTWAKRQKSS